MLALKAALLLLVKNVVGNQQCTEIGNWEYTEIGNKNTQLVQR
jgi:hypothetical protein